MPGLKIPGLLILVMLVGLLIISQVTLAQDANSCESVLTQAIQTTQELCSGLEPGNACIPSGETIALDAIDRLQTSALNLDANQWESALIKVATNGEPIAMALFGGAEIVNTAEATLPTPEPLQAANKSGYNVNLRQGPGKDYELAGFFGWDKTAPVDGRSADGEWLRLQTETGFAWINADLVTLNGDANGLPILSGDVTPMQAFTLTTPDSTAACGAGASGLLVSHTSSEDVGLRVNGANLTFGTATLLLQAQPNARLEIYVINGETVVNADGEVITANQGESAEVPLAGSDGLEADAAPLVKPSYPLNTLIGIPLELVSDETLACTAGVIDSEASVWSFQQPNAEATVANLLVTDAHYSVLGQAEDDQGNRWWQLQDSWVRQDTVQVTGACDEVTEISADQAVSDGVNVSTNTGATTTLFSTSLVPAGDMIWSADPGHDILSGTCVMPPLPVCPHPTAITPNGATLTWRGQEPLPYTLRLTGDNSYSFNGRNNLNSADVSMSLTFTSPTAWSMTMTQVFDNDPACVHTLYYNAVPR